MEKHTSDVLRRTIRSMNRAQLTADVELGLRVRFDEVALLFPDEEQLNRFIWDTRNVLENFSSVRSDKMERLDLPALPPQTFGVRFEFLRFQGKPWRIEAMTVLDGTAPLHEERLESFLGYDDGDVPIIHVSYKAESLEQYGEAKRTLAAIGSDAFAEYRNSYGIFSYWRIPDLGFIYIKPRVNLRDQEQ